MEHSEHNRVAIGGEELVALAADGLSADDIVRLVRFRKQVRAGVSPELSLDMKQLDFARWLYREGRVSG